MWSTAFNLPNQLTTARLILAVIMFGLIAWEYYTASTVLFIIAAGTDWLDGYYARKYNQVTNLGRILDPFADKVIVCGTFIFLIAIPQMLDTPFGLRPWMVVAIVGRELLVTALRSFIEDRGSDFSAQVVGQGQDGSPVRIGRGLPDFPRIRKTHRSGMALAAPRGIGLVHGDRHGLFGSGVCSGGHPSNAGTVDGWIDFTSVGDRDRSGCCNEPFDVGLDWVAACGTSRCVPFRFHRPVPWGGSLVLLVAACFYAFFPALLGLSLGSKGNAEKGDNGQDQNLITKDTKIAKKAVREGWRSTKPPRHVSPE